MQREQCQVGMRVVFGRTNGEHTKGEVVKCNPTKAKIRTLETRGTGRGAGTGAVWNVPYSMMQPESGDQVIQSIVPQAQEKMTYNPFAVLDNAILEAIVTCYNYLSPENLFADGERPRSQAMVLKNTLQKQLRHLCEAFGRNVTEQDAYDWADSRQCYEAARAL